MSSKKERYNEYLKSAEWKHKRKSKLKQANFKCDGCGEKYGMLEVHHLTYDRVGMELLSDLAAYCINCHRIAHDLANKSEWNKYLSFNGERPKDTTVEDIEFKIMLDSI